MVQPARRQEARYKRWLHWFGIAITLAVASGIAVAAGLALAGSWWALGFETGWWQGDSNMNDGEGVPLLFVGIGLLSIGLTGWAVLGWLLLDSATKVARRATLVAGTALVLAAATGSMVYFVSN